MSATILAGTALAGSALSGYLGYRSTQQANRQQMKLAEYQNRKNLEMWHMNNAYNAPQAQMARLKSAGLNPNLVYGTGTVTGNTASQPSKYEAPNIQPYTGWNLGVGEASSIYLNARRNEAEVKNMQEQNYNLQAQRDLVRQQITSETFKQAQVAASTAKNKYDLGLAKKLEKYSLEAASLNIDKMNSEILKTGSDVAVNEARISLMGFEKELSKARYDNLVVATARLKQDMNFDKFEQDLKEIGIYPNDPLYSRLMVRLGRNAAEHVSRSNFDYGTNRRDFKPTHWRGKGENGVYFPGKLW